MLPLLPPMLVLLNGIGKMTQMFQKAVYTSVRTLPASLLMIPRTKISGSAKYNNTDANISNFILWVKELSTITARGHVEMFCDAQTNFMAT